LKKSKVSASKSLIENVVAGSRVLAQQGVLDAYGHVSARSDKRPDRFIMSRSRAPALVTAADIMEHDADSEVVGDTRKGLYPRRDLSRAAGSDGGGAQPLAVGDSLRCDEEHTEADLSHGVVSLVGCTGL
jgi:hypothetical protein